MKKETTISIKVLAIFLAATIPFGVLQAQQMDTTKVHSIKEVVISTSRSELDPDKVGRSISIISNEQIKASGANTLAEVLSQQEGIYIVGTGQNPGQIQNLFMRGANSNQTAIMIDGVRLTDPSGVDNSIDFSEISMANIDRIEIVRGSQSTLYGSSAIGGVINIITKKNQDPGIHVDADLRGGTFGTQTSMFSQSVFANYSHKSGFYANVGIYNNKTNGLDATIDTVTDQMNTHGQTLFMHQHRERDGFMKTDLSAKLGYRIEKLDLFVSYSRSHQKADIDARAYTDDHAYTVDFNRNLYSFGGSYKITPRFNVAYIGSISDLTRIALDDSSIVDSAGTYNHNYYKGTYKASTANHQLQANYRVKGMNAVIGVDAFNEKMTAQTFSFNSAYNYELKQNYDSLKINVNSISEFAHVDLDGSLFNNSWNIIGLSLGARNTQHQLFGNNLTWEINPSLKVSGNGLLFASWSTGFNAPSLYQLYAPDQDPGSHITRGNPTLKAETSTSMEFGFKQKVNDNVSFHFSFFKTIVENSIDYVYLWDNSKPVNSLGYMDYRGDTYVNIGRQTNQGFEVGLSTKISEKLFISGNVSLINGKLDYDPASINPAHTQGNRVQLFTNGAFLDKGTESFGLVRRPSTANISATYKLLKNLSVRADMRYAGPRSDIYYNSNLGPNGAQSTKGMGDYMLVDLFVKYNIIKGLSAGLRVENIFDEKYYEIYGYTTRGRSLYLNLRYSF
jgi:vitamin B12 transporter